MTCSPGEITAAIYGTHVARRAEEPPRLYLGASGIGAACARAVWYQFRGAVIEAFDGRVLRLFDTGHREEDRLIGELRAAGFEVLDRSPRTRRQFEVQAFGGLFGGHLDGLIRIDDRWLVLECKTANAKSYADVMRRGMRESKPEHFAQVTIYLGLAAHAWPSWGIDGEPPSKALYLVVCKDTDAINAEFVDFDAEAFDELGRKAHDLITSSVAPPRIADDPGYFRCRWCDASGICHGTEAPAANCRSCEHGHPDIETGRWICRLRGEPIPGAPCAEHAWHHGLEVAHGW